VSAKSSGSNLASATFTVTTTPLPTISLNPTNRPASTSVKDTGRNFATSSAVTISYDNTNLATNPTTVTTTSTGSFSATITVPASTTPGGHTVSATDASSNSASATFTVTTSTTSTLTVKSQDSIGNPLGQYTTLTQGGT